MPLTSCARRSATEVDALRTFFDLNRQYLALELESVEVKGNEAALTALIRNVLENAIRYTPVKGSIFFVCVRREGNTATLIVADSGPGIAVEERERVFDRFYRALGWAAWRYAWDGRRMPLIDLSLT